MFARAITMLALIAIAVVTTMSSAHAARMSAMPDHAGHVAEMMAVAHDTPVTCTSDQDCGPAATGLCAFVCNGLSIFLPSPGDAADQNGTRISHDQPLNDFHTGRAPGLNERPPKIHLL